MSTTKLRYIYWSYINKSRLCTIYLSKTHRKWLIIYWGPSYTDWGRSTIHTLTQTCIWILYGMRGNWGVLVKEGSTHTLTETFICLNVARYAWGLRFTDWGGSTIHTLTLWQRFVMSNIVRYASMGTKVYWLRRLHNTHTFTETCDVWILQDLHPLELRFTDLGGRTIHIDRDLWCLNIVRYASIGTEVYWLRRLHNTRTDRDL